MRLNSHSYTLIRVCRVLFCACTARLIFEFFFSLDIMLRKNFMKRLSKSASDISGCKKKTHSTSPEEEEKEGAFSTPTHVSADEADEEDDGSLHGLGGPRPSSAASTRSVPEFPATSTSSEKRKTPLTGTLGRKAKKLLKVNKKPEPLQPSEVGIRNVGGQIHSAYRGHQVIQLTFIGVPLAVSIHGFQTVWRGRNHT